jgi:hypothetical protein
VGDAPEVAGGSPPTDQCKRDLPSMCKPKDMNEKGKKRSETGIN